MDIFSFITGLILGIVSGLIPGLHSNTVIAALSTIEIPPEAMGVVIIALFSAHIVVSFVPSIFFGIPSDSSVVSVLPGQRMVREGKGILALKTVLFSSLFAALVCVALFPISIPAFSLVYSAIRPYLGYILVLFSGILILRARNAFLSLGVFLLSGILGIFTLGGAGGWLKMYDPFLPMFTGFFAMAAILAYKKCVPIPKQKDEKMKPDFLKYSLLGVLFGFFADLLPGIGAPSQIATFATIFIPMNTMGYLAAISSISTSQSIFSLSTSAAIGKTRMGATEWLSGYVEIGENLFPLLVLFLVSVAVSAGLIYLLRKRIGAIAGIDFSHFNILLAAYLIAIVFVLDGLAGLAVFALAGGLGYATIKLNAERTMMMGSVIVPTILVLFKVFLI